MSTPTDYPSALRPYSPNSRIREVEARIRAYITDNNLQAGQRLPGEEWFAEQLQVGRPLVREALKGMEAVGRIETRRGVGRFVAAFDPDAYLRNYTTDMLLLQFSEQEIQETRCLLEITMAADATSRLTEDDLVLMRQYFAAFEAAVAEGRTDTEADLGLHRTIMQRSENRLIVAMLDAVYALSKRRQAAGRQVSVAGLREDLAEHAAIVRAAEARDGPGMRQALIDHFRTTATRLGFEQRWHEVFSQPMTEVHHAGTRLGT
jgi:GntR family transcriptional repressor for pyruvate dehydrogenase complex